jgi:hypothetical protein
LIGSADSSAKLDPKTLAEVERLCAAFPIEVKEACASPKQLRFQKAFFDRRDPDDGRPLDIFVAMGGNRSGKSIVAGWLCFAKYLRDVAKDGDWFWCVGQTLDRSIGGQQKELWNALPRWMFGNQRWEEKGGFASGRHAKITLPTRDGGKCLVEFRSADQHPSTFEQAKLAGVWCDERLPEEIYDRLLPRIVDRDGFLLYSDIPEQWWQFERLKEARPEAGVYFQHLTMRDNAHNLPPGAVEKAASRMTADERTLRIDGEFVIMEGVVFKEYVDRPREQGGHLVKRFTIPPDWVRWRLIDYGGSAPTGCLWVAMAPNEHLYAYREHYLRGKSVEVNAGMIIEASGPEVYRKTFMDPHAVDRPPAYYGSSPTVADQYAAAGIKSTGWPFVNVMGEHALVQRIKFRLEHFTLWIFDDLVNFRRELRSWKYKLDKDGKPIPGDSFENDNNHLIDPLKGFLGTNPCFVGGDQVITVPRRK